MKKPTTIKNEIDFRRWLHVTGEELGYHVSHIESPQTSPGIPDLNLAHSGLDIWLECKVWRDGIHMLPSQRRWHRARKLTGGESFVVCWIDGYMTLLPGHVAAGLSPVAQQWRWGHRYRMEDPAALFRTIREALFMYAPTRYLGGSQPGSPQNSPESADERP